jgi:hypothetical protein
MSSVAALMTGFFLSDSSLKLGEIVILKLREVVKKGI